MKLFFREQLPLIIIYILQLIVMILVFWLDGYQNVSISLYAALLSGCLFTGYLVYRYVTHRTFYKRLDQPSSSVDVYQHESSRVPLVEAHQVLLQNQHQQFQTELRRCQIKLKEQVQFINQWVHQMKTPLSVIHLMIQDEDDTRFHAIADELDRMKKGLETVLYTARLDEFEHDLYVEKMLLEKVVRNVTSSQKRLFIRNRVFPTFHFEENLTIASDEKWLSFVITQLITNAVRYSAGGNKKINMKGYRRGANIVLEVEDEGVGITKSDLPRIFEPYFTGENGRNFQESTGMGLYLVKQICDKLGHRIEIESTVNKGTTIHILF